ncbi:MAG: prolyl oligopeptidase family serine peptidase [Candidatus Heimdallarchaeota archaeon]|nr:prolyl oligopeptidase family serine peptidase [Candidatus Heimdallarchaeota archaeon]
MKKEKVHISFSEEYLSGMIFYPENGASEPFPIVCKCHGLIANDFVKEEPLAQRFAKEGIAYFIFHFTGFKESPGTTSIRTSLANLDRVISFMVDHPAINARQIGIYGVSLGGAIAICHTARDPRISSLAIQAPLFDFNFLVNYPEFSALYDGLTTTGLIKLPEKEDRAVLQREIQGNNPMDVIANISPRPLLIIAGAKDTFMPLEGIEQLYQQAKPPKEFITIQEADHNLTDKQARKETFKTITNFFQEIFIEQRYI